MTTYNITIRTSVSYGDEVTYDKYDTFIVSEGIKFSEVETLFSLLRHSMTHRTNAIEELYHFLNDNGYWVNGTVEITSAQDEWIENHPEVHGEQTEFAEEVTITAF